MLSPPIYCSCYVALIRQLRSPSDTPTGPGDFALYRVPPSLLLGRDFTVVCVELFICYSGPSFDGLESCRLLLELHQHLFYAQFLAHDPAGDCHMLAP